MHKADHTTLLSLPDADRMSIKGIAFAAGFNNPAFFGKYVKHHTGMTPKQYRNHLRRAKEALI